jgi:hypothetical protein
MDKLVSRKPHMFSFALDHLAKKLQFAIRGEKGTETTGSFNSDEISRLMASLSQFHHALELSEITGEELAPPFNPDRPFEQKEGYTIAKFSRVVRWKVS